MLLMKLFNKYYYYSHLGDYSKLKIRVKQATKNRKIPSVKQNPIKSKRLKQLLNALISGIKCEPNLTIQDELLERFFSIEGDCLSQSENMIISSSFMSPSKL